MSCRRQHDPDDPTALQRTLRELDELLAAPWRLCAEDLRLLRQLYDDLVELLDQERHP